MKIFTLTVLPVCPLYYYYPRNVRMRVRVRAGVCACTCGRVRVYVRARARAYAPWGEIRRVSGSDTAYHWSRYGVSLLEGPRGVHMFAYKIIEIDTAIAIA